MHFVTHDATKRIDCITLACLVWYFATGEEDDGEESSIQATNSMAGLWHKNKAANHPLGLLPRQHSFPSLRQTLPL